MSRLQEYLKTPNPLHPQFFSPQSPQHEHAHNLFADHEGAILKTGEDWGMERLYRSPLSLFQERKSPIRMVTPRNPHKVIQEKLEFEDEEQQEIQTPVSRAERKTLLQTTAVKKYDLRVPGTLQSHLSDTKQSERTLRVLTSEAYNIVCEKGASTYKQVSEEIINNTSDFPSVKEQKNIKRRVYDALNVLIALGKLEKKGRKIIPHRNFQMQKYHQEKIYELKKLLAQKQALLKSKKKLYKSQSKKSLNLKKLIDRNQSLPLPNFQTPNSISMPFLITNHSNIERIDKNNTQIRIRIGNGDNGSILGDLDILGLLRFQNR